MSGKKSQCLCLVYGTGCRRRWLIITNCDWTGCYRNANLWRGCQHSQSFPFFFFFLHLGYLLQTYHFLSLFPLEQSSHVDMSSGWRRTRETFYILHVLKFIYYILRQEQFTSAITNHQCDVLHNRCTFSTRGGGQTYRLQATTAPLGCSVLAH